jgi:hypothetical protein
MPVSIKISPKKLYKELCNYIKLHNLGDDLLFQGSGPSTIDAKGLNFRVRDGNGCTPFA